MGTAAHFAAETARLATRRLLRPIAAHGAVRPPPLEGGRRLVLVQLDGISHARLEWAVCAGHMPFLAHRLATGRSRLSRCRSGAPTSTPAFQAGLLYGVAPSVPGFVWWDRVAAREVRMDRASDAAAVERRLASRGRGLLRGGTSYFSIFSGGAALPHFCLSGLAGEVSPSDLQPPRMNGWDSLATALVHSVTAARVAGRLAGEVALGAWEGLRWCASLGRLKHEGRFFVHRLLVGALFHELAVQGLLVDVSRGVPAIFCDFVAYDEFAHRRGPDSAIALAHLASIDAALAVIFGAVEAAPELRYDVYLLSDHGHVATRPFESLTGLPLPDYLALADRGVAVPHALDGDGAVRLAQTRGLRAFLDRLPTGRLRALAGRALDGAERRVVGHALGFSRADRIVTAEAGDLAHVYLAGEREPLPLEGLRVRCPGVIEALRDCRAVGIVAARGGRRGLALVRGAERDLADPADVALLPHPHPALLATYLADLLSIDGSGDLVVLGWRGAAEDPVAYAWEFGSHGGVAPEEIETFVVTPPGSALDFASVRRPDEIYRLLDAAYRRRTGREPASPEATCR